jgi:hypothetical protein
MDRWLQRFEVSKRLYEVYPPGFRKGEGSTEDIRLYWLLGLGLALFHAQEDHVRYLSTLLKVCDLLCSVSLERLTDAIPDGGLAVVLAAEITAVEVLAQAKGLSIAD